MTGPLPSGRRNAFWRPAAAALPLLVLACNDGPSELTPEPAIGISISPNAVELEQGATASVTANVTRTDFTGPVTVSLSGLPSGVTAQPLTLSGGGATESGTLTIQATAAAEPGSATATVQASASGVEDRTASLDLTVEALPVGDFSLGLSPATLTVMQGESGSTSVAITRTDGFDGEVTLSADGLPSGVSASFDPETVAGASATLTLSAAADAEVGDATVRIRGHAEDPGTREAELSLEITERTAGELVTMDVCEGGGGGFVDWVAVQDGTGPWRRITPEVLGGTVQRFTFEITQGRAGVASVNSAHGQQQLLVTYSGVGTFQDNADLSRCDPADYPLKTVHGTVSGVNMAEGQVAGVTVGGRPALVTPEEMGMSFTVDGVRQGAQDLVAFRTGAGTALLTDRIILRRGITPADGSTLETLDFAGEEAFDAASAQLTLENLGGQLAAVQMNYFTLAGLDASRGFDGTGLLGALPPSTQATRPFRGVPANQQLSGELHVITAAAFDDENGNIGRLALLAFDGFGDQSLAFGPQLTAPTLTTLGGGRVQVLFEVQAEYDQHWYLNFAQAGQDNHSIHVLGDYVGGAAPGGTVEVTGPDLIIHVSDDYVGGAAPGSTVEVTIPDLSGVDGWQAEWGLAPGVPTEVSAVATGGTVPYGFPVPHQPGAVRRMGHFYTTLTP